MHYYRRLCAVLFSVFILAGCVATSVTGKKVGTIDQPMERVGVAINPVKFKGYDMASSLGNGHIASLFPHLTRRVPIVFGLNGIDSKAAMDESGSEPHELNTYSNILRIIPQSAFYSSRSGSQLEIGMQLVDAEKGKLIWRGSFTMSTLGGGKFEEDLADEFARKLLVKLNEDGLIKLKGPEVVMPPKKVQDERNEQSAEKASKI